MFIESKYCERGSEASHHSIRTFLRLFLKKWPDYGLPFRLIDSRRHEVLYFATNLDCSNLRSDQALWYDAWNMR